jgi:hypothetical protein
MKFDRKFFGFFTGLVCAIFLLAGTASISIISTALPYRTPNVAIGRVIPQRMKGVTVYLTEQERAWYYLANGVAAVSFVVMCALIGNRRRFGVQDR